MIKRVSREPALSVCLFFLTYLGLVQLRIKGKSHQLNLVVYCIYELNDVNLNYVMVCKVTCSCIFS